MTDNSPRAQITRIIEDEVIAPTDVQARLVERILGVMNEEIEAAVAATAFTTQYRRDAEEHTTELPEGVEGRAFTGRAPRNLPHHF